MQGSEDKAGRLLKYLLTHMKSIEVRMDWSKAIDKFHAGDKQKITGAINRVRLGINDILSIVKDPDVRYAIRKDLDEEERLVYYMTLTDQLFDLTEEDLYEVTEMIDAYLLKKYNLDKETPESI